MTDTKSPYILALDIGTSSTRALLFDATGSTVPGMVSQHTYQLTTTSDGEVSVGADMLVGVVAQTIDEVLKQAADLSSQIKAVAIDTFWHSLLGVDENNHPLTPVITWEDTRAFGAARELRKEFDEKAVHDRVSVRFHASYWPAKLRWLAQNQSEVFKQVKQWISFGEYLHRVFLGKSVCSISMASATGMMTTKTQQWDRELMRALDIRPEQLPQIGDVRDALQGLQGQYATIWPALHNIPWFPAIGDGASACIGTGCVTDKDWSLTMGTSSALRVVIEPGQISAPPLGLWMYFVDAKRAILGGALSEGGNLLAWLTKTMQLPELKDSEPKIAALAPDSHGLTILPFISGERSIGWHAEARMTIAGLSIHTAPEEILRAGMEAIAYRLYAIHQALSTALQQDASEHHLMASGGVLFHSNILRHIIADTLNSPIYPSQEQEASARGAALLALEALGIIPDLTKLQPNVLAPTQPDPKNEDIYRLAAARQDKLYQLLLAD
ncbi:gluconokinase [Dictyobacter arantiisoli]|uniref:Gluconate kinase n=1 Tax=Dictyobacter arantiisoli TaxID=2014874 RepID=A0A5A5THA0_9CHLR|nr:gluconokinase [Dictyobacter arantiisoli]GCF10526.1 gluconate kinase [Dictyobacter arantiisoli]